MKQIFCYKSNDLLRKISLTLLSCLLCLTMTFAETEQSNTTKISLQLVKAPISQAISHIEKNTDYVFLISEEVNTQLKRNISINAENREVREIMEMITRNTGLNYLIVEKQIILYSKEKRDKGSPYPVKQEITVTGKITDSSGEPIVGATIRLKGAEATGTVTDANGSFSFKEIPDNAILIVSFIGFQTIEYPVAGQRTVTIVLKEETTDIDEVVVVGYGTQKKLTLTGSVISTTGESIQKSASVDISSSLAGRMPGVIVNNRSGEPGVEATTIFIRGRSTLGDNTPLIIIDGVPGRESLSFLDPNDIENITVLKDASAAIYGSRSANGVILVTTKRGKRGEKPKITFSYDLGVQTPTRLLDMVDAPTYAQLYNERNEKVGGSPRYTEEEIQKFADGSDPIAYANTDWFNEIIKPASFQHKYNLSFAGGTNAVAYFASVGAVTQDGIYHESATKYNQLNLRSNIDVNVTQNFRIGVDVSARIQNKHYSAYSSDDYGIFYITRDKFPTTPAYYPNGLLAGGGNLSNPLALVSDRCGYDKTRLQRLNTTLSADWDLSPLIKGLSVKGHIAYDNTSSFRKKWQKPYTYYLYNETTKEYEEHQSKDVLTPQLWERYVPAWALTLNAIINYDRTFNDMHHIGATIGFEQSESRNDVLEAERTLYSQDVLDELFAGDLDKTYYDNTGSASETARRGFFGRVSYDFKGKYLAQFILRHDGSENFPKEKRWGTFPGVSVGWRISEERFVKNNLSFMDNLKIRASYGEQGNDKIDPFQFLTTYQYGRSQVFDGKEVNGIYPGVFPNVNVTWEVAKTYNIGLDGTLWKGKLGFEMEAFKTERSNILCTRNASVPAYTGLTSLPDENIGIVNNKGFEIQLSHQGNSGNFTYNISGNFLYARNKVVYMDEAPWGEGYDYLKQEGHPMGALLLYEVIGINKTEEDLEKYPQFSGATLGDFIFKRNDPNPADPNTITSKDRKRTDLTTIPEIVFGLSFDARWKMFDFMVLFSGQARAKYYISRRIDPAEGNILQDIADGRWSKDNPTADKPGVGGSVNGSSSTWWHRDASFLRLKNVELGMNLPGKWLDRSTTGIDNLRIYIGGYNLLTFDKLKIVDPETSDSEAQNYPQLRIFNAGVRLTF
ncbi:MAG: TonB-dependent receptor [Mangrovibacterium sp.]